MHQLILRLPLNLTLNLIVMLTWSSLIEIALYLMGFTAINVTLIPSIPVLEQQIKSQLLMLQLLTLAHTPMRYM